MLIQPKRVISSLMRREMAVAAARTNHHRRARRPAQRDGVGQIQRERGDALLVAPSAPGAPPGQSGIGACASARDEIESEKTSASDK